MENWNVGLGDTCQLDGDAGVFVGKVYVSSGTEGIVEGDGKFDRGFVVNLVAHADRVGNMLDDRLGLHLGIAGVEDDTVEAIDKYSNSAAKASALTSLGLPRLFSSIIPCSPLPWPLKWTIWGLCSSMAR